ncbi:MAG: hypothetical protein KDC95_19510 [Planctomycetes bacterium]|nr:hypothetical protein [Planctomycetota bacterium]
MARRQAVVEEAPIEILDEGDSQGQGIDFAIIVTTSILLIGALVFAMMALGDHYGRGPLAG